MNLPNLNIEHEKDSKVDNFVKEKNKKIDGRNGRWFLSRSLCLMTFLTFLVLKSLLKLMKVQRSSMAELESIFDHRYKGGKISTIFYLCRIIVRVL